MGPGPVALHQALSHPYALAEPQSQTSEPDNGAASEETEKTGDGFTMQLESVFYRVSPCPPFGERLKVVLKACLDGKSFVDTPNLFSHRSRAATATQLMRQFQLSREQAEDHLRLLLGQAESWAEELMRQSQGVGEAVAVPELTAQERETALAWLCRSNLTRAILDDMETLGYVGEESGKLLAYLIGVSRKLDRPLAGIVRSESGAGKSGMVELVELLTPPRTWWCSPDCRPELWTFTRKGTCVTSYWVSRSGPAARPPTTRCGSCSPKADWSRA